MAVCRQNLPLGALSSLSTHSVPVGPVFKKFGLFLNTPRMYIAGHGRAERYFASVPFFHKAAKIKKNKKSNVV
jgi:hypothetical protein